MQPPIKYTEESILSILNETFKDSHKFYKVTYKSLYRHKKIKYCDVEILEDSFCVTLNGKTILEMGENDDEFTPMPLEVKFLMIPIELGEIIFIGFPNEDRVYILSHEIITKYKKSVLYGYLESCGLACGEKFMLDDFNYDTFGIAYVAILDPEKISIIPDHIKTIMDKYGLIDESIYYFNNRLILEKNETMEQFINFVTNPNTMMLIRSVNDYNMLKKMYSDNYKIIPVQIMFYRYECTGDFEISMISILDGLLLKFEKNKIDFNQKELHNMNIVYEKKKNFYHLFQE
jgi:hypothetical protein